MFTQHLYLPTQRIYPPNVFQMFQKSNRRYNLHDDFKIFVTLKVFASSYNANLDFQGLIFQIVTLSE